MGLWQRGNLWVIHVFLGSSVALKLSYGGVSKASDYGVEEGEVSLSGAEMESFLLS